MSGRPRPPGPPPIPVDDPTAIHDTLRPDTLTPDGGPPTGALLDALRDGGLELGGIIGRGGMSTIYAATQSALGRTVAVKVPGPGDRRVAAMVAEAVVTGQLGHPGIVPVHALELDDDGRPRMVLERIEGQSWGALLAAEPGGAPDDARLAEHLRIWLRVCEAVDFAHARGIIHRDIKPDNVMVGGFGEVYLLDWGIAVTVDPGADPRIPRLTRHNATAGTPRYMPPEQVTGRVDAQGPPSDVFLLAATLYAVLCGRSVWPGATVFELWAAAAEGRIAPLPATVDPRLAALCMQGLALDPADRPPSVRAFARRVERWIEQRPALRLLDEVGRQVDRLEAAAAAGEGPRVMHEAAFETIRSSVARIEPLLPADAVGPLRGRAAVAIARILLADDDPDAAERRLALPGAEIDPATRQTLDAAIAEAHRARAERRAEAERHDPDAGRRLRGLGMGAFGALWVAGPLLNALTGTVPTLEAVCVGNALVGALIVAFFALRWRHLGRTVPNRLVLLACMLPSFGLAVMDLWALERGLDPTTVYVLHFLFVAAAVAIIGVGTEPRLLPVVGVPLAAFAVAAGLPDAIMTVTAVNNFALIVLVVAVTLKGAPREAP